MRMAYKIEKRTCWDCIPFASVGNSSLMQTCRAVSHCVAKLNQEIQMYLYNHSTSLFLFMPVRARGRLCHCALFNASIFYWIG